MDGSAEVSSENISKTNYRRAMISGLSGGGATLGFLPIEIGIASYLGIPIAAAATIAFGFLVGASVKYRLGDHYNDDARGFRKPTSFERNWFGSFLKN